jgi:hypothetical protein
MCLEKNFDETIGVINSIRERLRVKNDHIVFSDSSAHAAGHLQMLRNYRNFSTICEITPAAALVLAAEYQRWKELGHADLWVADVEHWADSVKNVLQRVGFFEIIGFESQPDFKVGPEIPESEKKKTPQPEMKILRLESGDATKTSAVRKLIDDLKELWPARDGEQGPLEGLYGAMIEAVGNVVEHAYPVGIKTGCDNIRKWWITGALDKKGQRTMAVVYDQGVSIPVSLPRSARFEGVAQRLRQMDAVANVARSGLTDHWDGEIIKGEWDHRAIEAAVEESLCAIGQPGRGQGLAQMKQFVDQCKEGYLRIASRNGTVVFRPNQKPLATYSQIPLGGTLIEWSVSL